ncbi:MAG: hypothetical protein ABIS50_19195 [Luteolibacter sp.]|uniref:hypothetical protein n=1 Tax=Luteolibacter sp. TaxID=1962973 RepID=UPI00326541AA
MSWTEVFPVLVDEMADVFDERSSEEEKINLRFLFEVDVICNQRIGCRHLVSTSLFWKHDGVAQGELPPISRDLMVNASELGLARRYDPWESYVVPLIEGAKMLRKSEPDIALRVYLANDLSFLIDDLVKVGCEVYLMKNSSICHNPGAMWRFLALEEASDFFPVTITDSDRVEHVLSDLARTEAARKVGVGGWRTPYNLSGSMGEGYRPMSAAQFRSTKSYPMRQLMRAFIWHNLKGTMPAKCELAGLRENRIAGSAWPDYGFDEWFLLAVMYPRMAYEGLLTFVPWDIPSLGQFFALDIEYCTWASPKSELINYPNPESALGDVIRPWAEWKDGARLRIRSETTVVKRARKKIGALQGIFNHTQRDEVEKFPNYTGDLPSFLAGASANVAGPWFVDLNPLLHLSSDGGELFLDRRYGDCDLVFCGYYFIKITSAIADWARSNALDEKVWGEGKLLKVPKLEGPMTLWKTDFSRKFRAGLVSQIPFVKAEILLRAWMDQGKVAFADTTAKQMGWKVR